MVDKGGIGGQASSSALIRNFLGFPRGISGSRLAQQAYEQAWVLGRALRAHAERDRARAGGDGRLLTTLGERRGQRPQRWSSRPARAIAGSDIPALEELNGAGVFYGGSASEAPAMAGRDVYVVGGANSAGQAALHLAHYARRVTLVVRAQSLAARMSHYLVRQIEASTRTSRSSLRPRSSAAAATGWLDHLVLRSRAARGDETVPADGLFLMIGAEPADRLAPGRDQPRRTRVPPDRRRPAGDSGLAARTRPRSGSRRACRGSSRSATSATAP